MDGCQGQASASSSIRCGVIHNDTQNSPKRSVVQTSTEAIWMPRVSAPEELSACYHMPFQRP